MQRRKLILPVVGLSLMTVISAVAGLNMALPSMARETGATQAQLTWIIDAYTVVFASLLFLAGAIGDKYGRKRILAFGLLWYAVVAAFGLFVTDPTHLIIVRTCMGVGAAAIMPSTLSVITTSFEGEERGKAIGIWVGIAGGGAVIGLFGTAILLEFYAWNSFFALNMVLATLGLIGTLAVLPESKEVATHRLDWIGALLTIVGVGAAVFGIIEGPEKTWGSPITISALGIGIVGIVLFIIWELRQEHPLLDPRLFRNRTFAAGSLAITLQFFGLFGMIFVAMQYLQFIVGFSPLEAVARLLPMPFFMLPAARVSGRLADRYPQKFMGAFGMLSVGIGLFLFSKLTVDFNFAYWTLCLAFFALGAAPSATAATTAITQALPYEEQGVASAMNDTAREFGSAFGIAILGAMLNDSYRNAMSKATMQLPEQIAERLMKSVAFVQMPKPEGASQAMWDQLVTVGKTAFTDGVHAALLIAALVAWAAAALIFLIAPRRPDYLARSK